MSPSEQSWFTEAHESSGSSIGFRVRERLHAEQTPFQHIEIYDSTDWGKLMVIDGCMMLTTRDNFFYHEMMSHPALFTHPRARPNRAEAAFRTILQDLLADHPPASRIYG